MAGITLAQITALEKDPMKKYIGMQLIRESKVMENLPFSNVDALQVNALWWEKLPTGGAFRSVNEGYSSYEDGQVGDGAEFVYGFGGDVTFDTVLEMIKNTVGDPVKMQVDARLKSMAITWNNYLINGDTATDPKGFNGLKKRVAAMPSRQTVYYTSSTSAAPLDPTASAANARRFLNMINAGWRYCNQSKVSTLICNEDFIVGFSRVLSLLQGAGNYLSITKDQFGREEISYRGVPFADIGLKQDQSTEIIATTETAGDGGADSMSQYLCSYNTEEGVYGIQLNQFNAYDPLKGAEMESKPSKLMRVDWWNGIASFGRHGIVRMRNLARLADWTE